MTVDEMYQWIEGLGGEKLLAIWLLTIAVLVLSAYFALYWRKLQYRAQYSAQKRRYDEAMNDLHDRLRGLAQENAQLKALLGEDEVDRPKNVFADVYNMKDAVVPDNVPSCPQNMDTQLSCPECNWHGTLRETITSYGHTLCPYCRREFKEVLR